MLWSLLNLFGHSHVTVGDQMSLITGLKHYFTAALDLADNS